MTDDSFHSTSYLFYSVLTCDNTMHILPPLYAGYTVSVRRMVEDRNRP